MLWGRLKRKTKRRRDGSKKKILKMPIHPWGSKNVHRNQIEAENDSSQSEVGERDKPPDDERKSDVAPRELEESRKNRGPEDRGLFGITPKSRGGLTVSQGTANLQMAHDRKPHKERAAPRKKKTKKGHGEPRRGGNIGRQ